MHPQDTELEILDLEIAIVRAVASLAQADRVDFEDEGWDSRVYVVNDGALVFKFPRSPAVQARYADELAVLRALAVLDLPVRTPRVRWVGLEHAYFGYVGVRGESPMLDDLDHGLRVRIGAAVGAFVHILHGLDLHDLPVMTVDDEIADFQAKYAAAEPIVAEQFTVNERGRLDRFYGDTLPAELRRLGGDPRPCHGDLGPWNLIVDADGSVGVIDFGDVVRCDRSKDFIGLYDDVALDAALAVYGDGLDLREKIAVRAAALPAMDLVFFAGKNDAERLAICVDRMRRGVLA